MVERGRGEWPSVIVAVACGAAFVCGLFVSWAVFAEQARAETTEASRVEQTDLLVRIGALEDSLAKLSAALESKTAPDQPRLQAAMLTTNLLTIVDAQNKPRMVMTAVTGSPRFEITREDKSLALVLTEHNGQPTVVLYDTTGKERVELLVNNAGNGIVRLIDAKGKVRVGMLSTADNEAEFFRFDKFGNAKTFE